MFNYNMQYFDLPKRSISTFILTLTGSVEADITVVMHETKFFICLSTLIREDAVSIKSCMQKQIILLFYV